MPNPRSPRLRLVPVLCAVGLACLGQPGESAAEEVRATSRAEIQRFDIPAGELAQVLLSIVRQSRTPIAFDQHLVEGLPAPAIQGSYSVEQALQRALQGSGLEYSRSAAGVLSLQRATAPDAALPAAKPAGTLATVVVTGTRKADVKAGESLAPIDVVSAEQLRDSGSGDLRDALVRLLPSLSRQAQAYNASALTNAQSLRGLSPNHVLVLVNGKRRHETANINVSGGLQSGSTGVDLDTIPLAAIERIEVLRDGASAQYGSDAIAGVINVILKSVRPRRPARLRQRSLRRWRRPDPERRGEWRPAFRRERFPQPQRAVPRAGADHPRRHRPAHRALRQPVHRRPFAAPPGAGLQRRRGAGRQRRAVQLRHLYPSLGVLGADLPVAVLGAAALSERLHPAHHQRRGRLFADPRRPWRRAVRRLGLGPQLDLRRRPPGDRHGPLDQPRPLRRDRRFAALLRPGALQGHPVDQ